MKTVLIIANEWTTILNFRMELISELVKQKIKVYLALPQSEHDKEFVSIGCHVIHLPLSRKGMNPIEEYKLLNTLASIIKKIQPSGVLTFTIKPNCYGGIICQHLHIPYIANITGLGTSVENKGIRQKISLMLYRAGLKKAEMVFFQNNENMSFMVKHRVCGKRYELLPGSGVNLEKFRQIDYPKSQKINFIYVARAMKEKGIDQYLVVAERIKRMYANVDFHVFGMAEQGYESILKEKAEQGIVIWHGQVRNMPEVYAMSSCTVHPSYYPEGMSNVLLESAATGRPIITTNRAGCREIIDDGVNGFLVEAKNSDDLEEKIERFINLPWESKMKMGLAGRRKIEKTFDRRIVVARYLDAINRFFKDGCC